MKQSTKAKLAIGALFVTNLLTGLAYYGSTAVVEDLRSDISWRQAEKRITDKDMSALGLSLVFGGVHCSVIDTFVPTADEDNFRFDERFYDLLSDSMYRFASTKIDGDLLYEYEKTFGTGKSVKTYLSAYCGNWPDNNLFNAANGSVEIVKMAQ